MEPGYALDHFNKEQVELMTDALQNFFMLLEHWKEGKLEVDFGKGETLLRFFSEEQDQWLNTVFQEPRRSDILQYLITGDDNFAKAMANIKKISESIKLEIFFMPGYVKAEGEHPCLTRNVFYLIGKAGTLEICLCANLMMTLCFQ